MFFMAPPLFYFFMIWSIFDRRSLDMVKIYNEKTIEPKVQFWPRREWCHVLRYQREKGAEMMITLF